MQFTRTGVSRVFNAAFVDPGALERAPVRGQAHVWAAGDSVHVPVHPATGATHAQSDRMDCPWSCSQVAPFNTGTHQGTKSPDGHLPSGLHQVMDLKRLELLTSSMPLKRSPN